MPKLRKISPAELAAANGAQGRPVYLAYSGRVYDASASELWVGGEHMVGHRAGHDLTAELPDAPHGPEVLERLPQVGLLEEAAAKPEETNPRPAGNQERHLGGLEGLLHRFPLLRRHPHPMVVHFPIVFMISASVFTFIYLVSGVDSFETTGFYCLGGGILFTPVAMLTGLFTWWLNYQARPLKPVIIKLILSPLMLLAAIAAFSWRLVHPEVLARLEGWSILYFALLLSMTPLVSVIGWYGATLTFPLHEDSPGN